MENLSVVQLTILFVGLIWAGCGSMAAVGWLARWNTKWIPVGLGVGIVNAIIYVAAVERIMGL